MGDFGSGDTGRLTANNNTIDRDASYASALTGDKPKNSASGVQSVPRANDKETNNVSNHGNNYLAIKDSLPSNDYSSRRIELPKEGNNSIMDNIGKEDSDLQKAIALSLEQSSTQERATEHNENGKKVTWGDITFSNEDTDMNKALEESLRTSKYGDNNMYAFDGDPNERKRGADDWPLGLQNIGNTCWFSSVIQSLFNISAFRNLVLNFNPPLNAATSDSAKKYFQFMKELRVLFAYLIGSTRKYVNPRKSVEIFKGAFEGSAYSNTQQDVSEFTSKLLEWVEEALKIYKTSLEPAASDYSLKDTQSTLTPASLEITFSSDQMLHQLKGIFYGEIETQGLTDRNETFENKEAFIQVPLQVRGFQTLYESIDASLQSEFTSTSSRGEQWITKLPKVVIFNLNRFIYNPSSQRTEKIHDRLQFPEVIYFDRFMLANQSATREKRKKVAELKASLNRLNSQLKYLQEFGSKGIPLKDGLQCVLDYASSLEKQANQEATSHLSVSEDMSDAGLMEHNNVEMRSPGRNSVSSTSAEDMITGETKETSCTQSGPKSDVQSDAESTLLSEDGSNSNMKNVITTLTMWKSRIGRQIQDLEAGVQDVTNQVEAMYNQDSLKTMPYKLHAVLVHEGDALSGHYWCFVQPRRDKSCPKSTMPSWLKFNDTNVTSANKFDVQKESYGGEKAPRPSCSAYCLIYVDSSSNDIFEENGNVSLDSLPEDLRQVVKEDNELFEKELENWNSCKDAGVNNNNISSLSYSRKSPNFAVAERDSNGGSAEHGREEHSEMTSSHDSFNRILTGGGATNKQQHLTSTPRDTRQAGAGADEERLGGGVCQVSDRVKMFNFSLSSTAMKQLVKKVATEFTTTSNSYSQVHRLMQSMKKELDEMGLKDSEEQGEAERWAGPLKRLHHIAYMALYLSVDQMAVNRCMLETFAYYIDEGTLSESMRSLQKAATRFVEEWTWAPDRVAFTQYNQLHLDFFQLYRVVSRFAEAFYQFQEGRHRAAMPEFINALEINSQGEWDPKRRLDKDLLFYFRRVCFINLNQEALDQFQSEDLSEQLEGLRLAQEFVIPVAGALCKSNADSTCSEYSQDNMQAVEHVRAQWFSLLANEIAPSLVEKFQDVLSKLTDECSLIDLAYKVDPSILTNFGPDLKLRSIIQIVQAVAEAVAYRNSKTDEMEE